MHVPITTLFALTLAKLTISLLIVTSLMQPEKGYVVPIDDVSVVGGVAPKYRLPLTSLIGLVFRVMLIKNMKREF